LRLPDPSFWQHKRVFITGAEGFKGTWLVKWLLKMGSTVRTSRDFDLCDKESFMKLLSKFQPEIVIHLAAVTTVQEAFENPIEAYRTNVFGTLTLLEVLKDIKSVKAILDVTTDKVYHIEGIDRGYVETDTLGGLENYAVSKACTELIAIVYQKTYKLPLATARAGNVIGGGDWKETRIIPNYFNAYTNKTVLDVNVDAIRPWQYVLDCLCGYLLLCEKLYDNISYVGAWNFASNEYEARSVQWIVDELNNYFTPQVKYKLVDARGYYETKNLKLCSDKARKVIGWEPKYDMKETIKRTAKWYLSTDKEFSYNREIEEYLEV
jgi:CDP-glucose 4,6-dehydratase